MCNRWAIFTQREHNFVLREPSRIRLAEGLFRRQVAAPLGNDRQDEEKAAVVQFGRKPDSGENTPKHGMKPLTRYLSDTTENNCQILERSTYCARQTI